MMFEIYEMPGHLVRRLHQAAVSLFMEEMGKRGLDLTTVQYSAMSAIHTRPGLDQATLAGHIAYDRVTIGGVVDRLVQKNYVRRDISASDRRARELYLTTEGTRLLEDIRPLVWRIQDQLLDGLDEQEKTTLVGLLRKAAEAVNERSRAPLRMT